MPRDTLETINVYVHIFSDPTDTDFPWSISFSSDPDGEMPILDGKIVVPRGGAMIYFQKRKATEGWNFHELTLHPVGPSEDKVDLKWIVTNDVIEVHNPNQGRRTFSYAISAQVPGSDAKIYFDPQLENQGGG